MSLNILITGVGGPTPRSFARALKTFGTRYRDAKLFATDINPLSIGLYQNDLFEKGFVIPRADAPDYWEVIGTIVESEEIDLAVILPEAEVLEWSRKQKTGELPCKALVPDPKLASVLVDKSAMTELLYPHGFVPQSVEFTREEEDLQSLFDALGASFWVRSSTGTSGLGSLLIESVTDLENWIRINPNVHTFLASTYLPGRNLACKLLYHKGKLLRSACAERVEYIMAKVAPSGITGNTSFGRLLNEPELSKKAVAAMDIMFEKTGAEKHGFFTVDFKEDSEGNALITEVNVRHVAFTQCFAAGGANFAEDTIRLLTNDESFDRTYRDHKFEEGLIFLRDVDEVPVMLKERDLLQ